MVDEKELMKKRCEFCGNSFIPNRKNQKYCSTDCRLKSNYERSKNRVYEYKCKKCGNLFTSKVRLMKPFCSDECEEEYKYNVRLNELSEDLDENLERNNINNEKGIIMDIINLKVSRIISMAINSTSVFDRTLNYWNLSDIPKNTRDYILQRDEHKCQICGRETKLHIHHMTKRIDGGNHEPDNLITLCESCHRYVETLDVERATKGCYKNALKYYDLEDQKRHITFDEIHRELLNIYNKCKDDEITEVLYRISTLLDRLEDEMDTYY